MEAFRWCFIGAGRLAHGVAEEILASGRHKIVSVYTRNWDSCCAFAQQFGAEPYRTAMEAMNDPEVDGVYIVTTHNAHYRFAKPAIEAGKHVLLEKAFTVEAADTDELIALAKEKGVYLAEAMWTWFGPVANQVRSWVQSGKIGAVQSAKLTYRMMSVNYAPRVSDPKRAGGALLDVGVYPITYLYRLFGKPVNVSCTGVLQNGIDISEEISMTFENGLTGHCSVSIVDENMDEALILKGEKGEIRSPFFHMTKDAELLCDGCEAEKFHGEGGYLNEFDIVASEIREGLTESRYVPLQATSDVMHIMDDCRAQMGLVYDCE